MPHPTSVDVGFLWIVGCGTALVSSLGPQRLGARQAFADPSASTAQSMEPSYFRCAQAPSGACGRRLGRFLSSRDHKSQIFDHLVISFRELALSGQVIADKH